MGPPSVDLYNNIFDIAAAGYASWFRRGLQYFLFFKYCEKALTCCIAAPGCCTANNNFYIEIIVSYLHLSGTLEIYQLVLLLL